MKKIIIVIVTIGLLIGLLFAINSNKIKDIKWTYFKPFSNSKYIKNVESPIKLTGNMPSIEAASAFYPLASGIVQNIYDEKDFKDDMIKMVSTSEAFFDFVNNKTDIIIATKPSRSQQELLDNCNILFERITLYKEPLIIYVNKKNKINNVELNDLITIYNEDNLNWSDYSGVSNKITTYQLEENNGSQTCIETIIGKNTINEFHKEINTMPKIIDEVGKDKNGIGYAFSQYYTRMHINKNTKIISVNGKNYTQEEYPLLFEVYLYFNKESANSNIEKLVKYLQTEDGKKLIKELL